VTSAPATVVVDVVAPPPAPTTRDPLRWPFSPDSIWNMPIGSGAVYAPTGLLPASALFGDIDYFFVLSASDPLQPLYNDEDVWMGPRCSAINATGISLNVPPSLVIADATPPNDTPNNSTAFLLPDGHSLVQVNALSRCDGNGPVFGVPSGTTEDLYGTGIYGGHAGSNLSSIGGTIRLGELEAAGPIRHALKIDVDGMYLFYSSGNPGFRWPANTADAGAPGGYQGRIPGMVQGSLLAVPPGATEASLGLRTEPGKKLFHALQDYGGYIVDNSADPSYNLCVESGVKEEFARAFGYAFDTTGPSPWFDDFAAIFAALRLVDDNGPQSVGGGGTPRVALAPPLR
jgi:hypothetical protein